MAEVSSPEAAAVRLSAEVVFSDGTVATVATTYEKLPQLTETLAPLDRVTRLLNCHNELINEHVNQLGLEGCYDMAVNSVKEQEQHTPAAKKAENNVTDAGNS